MQEVKRIFHEQYKGCEIAQRPEYRLENVESPNVYCVDCIFAQPPRKSGNRCDEFIFFNLNAKSTGIYLVERKDNNSHIVNKVKEQLQGGAGFIDVFLKKDAATRGQPLDFMPVWVSKGIRSNMRHQLLKIKISLRGIHKPIRHVGTKDILPKLT